MAEVEWDEQAEVEELEEPVGIMLSHAQRSVYTQAQSRYRLSVSALGVGPIPLPGSAT